MIGANFAERFLFIPSIFFSLAIVLLLERFLERMFVESKNLKLAIMLLAILFSARTFIRISDWRSMETLVTSSLEVYPESSRIQTAMGSNMREKAELTPPSPQKEQLYEQAVSYYKEALEILPSNFEAWYNIGVIYQNTSRPQLAAEAFRETLKYSSSFTNAYNNLGVLYFNARDYGTAEMWLKKGLEYEPNNASLLGNLGSTYHNTGNYEKARQLYDSSLAINPNQPNIIKNKSILPR